MTVEVKNSRDFFHLVPTTQNDPYWDDIIIETYLYAPPEKVEGMEFFRRDVLPVSKPIRRSGDDNSSLNATRSTNPDRDNLSTIETKGLNVQCLPPRTIITNPDSPQNEYEEDLFGGYGRGEEFDRLKISFWIFDRYKPSTNFGKMQSCSEDVCEDGGISDNGRVSSKPPTKTDYVDLSLRKMKRHGWKEDKLRLWYDSIEHTLSPKQVNSYINDAIRRQTAQGRIEWKDESYVKKQAKKQKINVIPLNCDGAEDGNRQRLERKLIPMMKEYISSHKTQKLCLHNNKVSNHEDYDLANEKMVEVLEEDLNLIIDFADHWRVFKTQPIKITHRVTQKIGEDDVVGEIIDFELEE